MSAADHKANTATRGAVDLTEAVLLEGRVGETFEAVVLDLENHKAVVALDDPAVQARCAGADFQVGTRVRVRLTVADPKARRVLFEKV